MENEMNSWKRVCDRCFKTFNTRSTTTSKGFCDACFEEVFSNLIFGDYMLVFTRKLYQHTQTDPVISFSTAWSENGNPYDMIAVILKENRYDRIQDGKYFVIYFCERKEKEHPYHWVRRARKKASITNFSNLHLAERMK